MSAHSSATSKSAILSVDARVTAYDWQAIVSELDNYGCTVLQKLLSMNAELRRPSIQKRATSEATSIWHGMASARASTVTSNIRFRTLWTACERHSTHTWRA